MNLAVRHALSALLFGNSMVAIPTRPVPFSQMRFQPPRMRSGWTQRRHATLADASTDLDRAAITRAETKRSRQGVVRQAAVVGAQMGRAS